MPKNAIYKGGASKFFIPTQTSDSGKLSWWACTTYLVALMDAKWVLSVRSKMWCRTRVWLLVQQLCYRESIESVTNCRVRNCKCKRTVWTGYWYQCVQKLMFPKIYSKLLCRICLINTSWCHVQAAIFRSCVPLPVAKKSSLIRARCSTTIISPSRSRGVPVCR